MKTTVRYAKVAVSADGSGIVIQVGALLLLETLRATGLDQALSATLGRWRKPRAIHDPGKVVADLAMTLALGGDCLSDLAILRAEPEPFGRVASDPTVSRLVIAGQGRTEGVAGDPPGACVRPRAGLDAGR